MNRLQITDIKLKPIEGGNRMKAIASVTFDDVFVVHDIKIIQGNSKLFTAMPSRKTPDNEFKDIAHPITADMRAMLESAILGKYEEAISAENTAE